MNRVYQWGWVVIMGGMMSCKLVDPNAGPPDTRKAGRILISVDESFRPVMEEELKVFRASNPGADIIASYKPEAACLRDLQNDSTRMIFVTRGLTPDEVGYYKGKLQYEPSFAVLAYDAVAVIANKAAPDSVFTVGELADILKGKSAKPYTAVFDGLNATSTIRFALDSILRGGAFDPSHVFAADNSTGVIQYVATHSDAIGFVGVDWIGNPEDLVEEGYRQKVTITPVQCAVCPGQPYVYPTQEQILTKRYSFTRGLYYIMKENYDGLGTGLVDFLTYQRGQLIFRRSYLVPAILTFTIRNAKVQ
jgi:phosphate transport system substrate-binding protein